MQRWIEVFDLREAGHDKCARAGKNGFHRLRQFDPGHAGHEVIGDQDVRLKARLDSREGRLRRIGLVHMESQLAQHVRRDGADIGLIIDQKDNAGLRLGKAKAGGAFLRHPGLRALWQPDRDLRAGARLALNGQRAAKLQREAMGHGKAEARALPHALG